MSNPGLLYTKQELQNKLTAAMKVTNKDCWLGEKFCCFENGLTDLNKKAKQLYNIYIYIIYIIYIYIYYIYIIYIYIYIYRYIYIYIYIDI